MADDEIKKIRISQLPSKSDTSGSDYAVIINNGVEGLCTYKVPVSAVRGTDVYGKLIAGNDTLVITDDAITSDSTIDVYTDTYKISAKDVVVTTGTVTLTFAKQTVNVNVKVRIT